MTAALVPSPALLGKVALADAERRARGCARPVRLVGSTVRIDRATGQVLDRYSSAEELDGITWVRCGDRRAARCESCSREYKGDAWHLLSAGLVGGKGAPDTVTEHPTVFATLTAPSFGPVHGRRQGALAGPAATAPSAPTAGPSTACTATARPTAASVSRCARTATTTPATCSGSGTPPSSGDASPSPSVAPSPAGSA